MAEFKIPKGKPYQFTIKVVAKDSFLAQDLADMDTATFELIDIDTSCVYGTTQVGVIQGDPEDGIIKFSLSDTYTDGLSVARGEKIDNYYPKVSYQGVITISFIDTAAIENRVTTIDKVYVIPTGC